MSDNSHDIYRAVISRHAYIVLNKEVNQLTLMLQLLLSVGAVEHDLS